MRATGSSWSTSYHPPPQFHHTCRRAASLIEQSSRSEGPFAPMENITFTCCRWRTREPWSLCCPGHLPRVRASSGGTAAGSVGRASALPASWKSTCAGIPRRNPTAARCVARASPPSACWRDTTASTPERNPSAATSAASASTSRLTSTLTSGCTPESGRAGAEPPVQARPDHPRTRVFVCSACFSVSIRYLEKYQYFLIFICKNLTDGPRSATFFSIL